MSRLMFYVLHRSFFALAFVFRALAGAFVVPLLTVFGVNGRFEEYDVVVYHAIRAAHIGW